MPPRKRALSPGGGPEQPPIGKRQKGDVEATNDTGESLPKNPPVDGEEDVGQGLPKPKRKSQSKKQARPPVDVEELAKVNSDFAAYASLGLQENDPSLRNTARIFEKLRTTILKRLVRPEIPLSPEVPFSIFMSTLSPMPGRIVVADGLVWVGGSSRSWQFTLRDHKDSTDRVAAGKQLKSVQFKIDGRLVTEDEAEAARRAVDAFVRLHHTWPWPWPVATGMAKSAFQRFLLRAAVEGASPLNIAPRMGHTSWSEPGKLVHYIEYVDSTTGLRTTYKQSISPKSLSTVTIPALPPKAFVDTGQGSLVAPVFSLVTNGDYPYDISAISQAGTEEQQRMAHDALRHIDLRCHQVVATRAQMAKLIGSLRVALGLQKQMTSSIYNEGPLYHPSRYIESRTQYVSLPKPVLKDIGIKAVIKIYVYSLNAVRLIPVIDALSRTFTHVTDVRHSIIAAAKAADQVNRDVAAGVPPTSQCYCDAVATKIELHGCEACACLCICVERQRDRLGRWACRPCIAKQTAAVESDEIAGESLSMSIVRGSLTRGLRQECKLAGTEPEDEQAIRDAAMSNLREKLSDCGPSQYVDEFTGRKSEVMHEVPLPLGVNPTTPRHHAETPSVDAVLPRMISKVITPPRYFVHAEGNLAIISRVLQFAKFTYLPGTLAIISDYLKLAVEHRTVKAKRDLLQNLQPFHILSYKHALRKVARTAGDVVQADFDQEVAQYISGKLLPQDDALKAKIRRVSHNAVGMRVGQRIWDDATTPRLASICSEMKVKHPMAKFDSAADGAPWIFEEEMPSDWCWNSWATICVERRDRMRTTCNRWHKMEDNAETIFLEWMYQHFTEDPQYGDGLGLPLVPWIGHALRASVAHKHHREGMFSGWPERAERLSDRDDAANNMLIESWLWNSAKGGMHETYYGRAADIIRAVDMPKAFYNPDLELPGHVVTEQLEDSGIVIDFPGESFDDDAFTAENDQGVKSGVAKSSFSDPKDAPAAEKEGNNDAPDAEMEDGRSASPLNATAVPGDQVTGDMIGSGKTLLERLREVRDGIRTDKDFGDKFLEDERVGELLGEAMHLARIGEEQRGLGTYNELVAILNEGRDD